jgi:hypothetical protein
MPARCVRADRHSQLTCRLPTNGRDVSLCGLARLSRSYFKVRDIGKQLTKRLPHSIDRAITRGSVGQKSTKCSKLAKAGSYAKERHREVWQSAHRRPSRPSAAC